RARGSRHPRAGARAGGARIARCRASARQRVLATRGRARARGCDPAPALQRAEARGRAAAHRRRSAGSARSRPLPRRAAARMPYAIRVLVPIAVKARSLIACDESGSCFAGSLAELAVAADRVLMPIGTREGDNRPPATFTLSEANFGLYPMGNGLTRLATRFLADPQSVERAKEKIGAPLEAEAAAELGLITAAVEDFDWDDDLRVMIEARAGFSADALSAMEANLRFAGPETLETKIFGRLSAWQNWVFQRPNAVGAEGALKRYGSGIQPSFDRERI